MDSIPQEMLDYINTSLIQGFTEKQIQETLLKNGYQQSYITSAFAEYYRQTRPQSTEKYSLSNIPSSITLLKESWTTYKKSWKTLIPMLILWIVFYIISLGIFVGIVGLLILLLIGPESLPKNITSLISTTSLPILIGSTITVLIFVIYANFTFTVGQVALLLYISRTTTRIFESFKKALSLAFPFLWVNFLVSTTSSFVFLILLILQPFLSFQIPFYILLPFIFFGIGIFIYLFTSFFFGPYILLVENIRGAQALLKSRVYVKGNWLNVFRKLLIIFIILVATSVLLYAAQTTLSSLGDIVGGVIGVIFIIAIFALFPIPFIYMYLLYSYTSRTKKTLVFAPPKKLSLSIHVFGIILLVVHAFSFIFVFAISPHLSSRTIDKSSLPTVFDLSMPEGRDIKRQDDLETIRGAVLYHRVFNPTYPNTLGEIDLPNDKILPRDPSTQQPYQYYLLEGGSRFEICANFETKDPSCLTNPD